MSQQNYAPGSTEVSWVKCSALAPQIAFKALAGIPVSVTTNRTILPIVGNATLTATLDNDNNGMVEKSKLQFTSTSMPPVSGDVAFIAKQANGQHWLIGAKEEPAPVVKITQTTGSPCGDVAAYMVEVTHIAHKSMIPVVI